MGRTRRELLVAGGAVGIAALTGCIATGLPGGSETDGGPDDRGAIDGDDGDGLPGSDADADGDVDGDDTGDTRPRGTGGPGMTLAGVDEPPDLPVRPTVKVTEDVATATHPPEMRVTVTNATDRTLQVGEGRAVVFAYVTDTTGDLILLPAEGEYPAEPDCWRLTEGVVVTEEYRVVTLEAGASTSQRVALYGMPADGDDGCLPVGTFRFESMYAVAEEGTVPDEGERRGTWGFSVTLE
jgi:hypothetical protein